MWYVFLYVNPLDHGRYLRRVDSQLADAIDTVLDSLPDMVDSAVTASNAEGIFSGLDGEAIPMAKETVPPGSICVQLFVPHDTLSDLRLRHAITELSKLLTSFGIDRNLPGVSLGMPRTYREEVLNVHASTSR